MSPLPGPRDDFNGSRPSYRRLLSIPDLPALLVAASLARLAKRMFVLVLVLYALGRFGSPALAGWLSFAAVAPGLAVGPLAGALIDRFGAVRTIGWDMLASAVGVGIIAALAGLDQANEAILLTLVTLLSLTGLLTAAGIRTMLPRLVPTAALDRANALDTAMHAVIDVVGPGVAGTLMGFAGPAAALAVIALCCALATVATRRICNLPSNTPGPASLLAEAMIGIVSVLRQPTLRGLAVSYALYQATWGALVVIVPIVAADDFVTGLLWAAAGAAAGLGALIAGRLRTTRRERALMAIGMLVTALAVWPVAAEFGLGGLIAGLLLAGAIEGPVDVALLTLRQRRTDPSEFGRVLSVSMSLNVAGLPIGSAVAGLLIVHSLSVTFIAAALVAASAAVAVAMIPADKQSDPVAS